MSQLYMAKCLVRDIMKNIMQSLKKFSMNDQMMQAWNYHNLYFLAVLNDK